MRQVICLAAFSVPFPSAREGDENREIVGKYGVGEGGEVTEGNACNETQTLYRTPPRRPHSLGGPTVTLELMIINFM